MDKPCCASCVHWTGTASRYAARCQIDSYPGLTLFDMWCARYTRVAVDMQSQARGAGEKK